MATLTLFCSDQWEIGYWRKMATEIFLDFFNFLGAFWAAFSAQLLANKRGMQR